MDLPDICIRRWDYICCELHVALGIGAKVWELIPWKGETFALRLKFVARYPIESPEVSYQVERSVQVLWSIGWFDRSLSFLIENINRLCILMCTPMDISALLYWVSWLLCESPSNRRRADNTGNDWSPGMFLGRIFLMKPRADAAVLNAVAICITMQSMLASNKKKER